MKIYANDDVFILSSACRITKGASQSILVDYQRNDLRVISNQYFDLIHLLNRNKVSEVATQIDDKSQSYFNDFLNFLLDNEFGFLTTQPECFPEISVELNDEYCLLKDCIIELNETNFEESKFISIIKQLDDLNCEDLQIRFLTKTHIHFIRKVLQLVLQSNICYIEIHSTFSSTIPEKEWFCLIEDFAILSHIYLYSSKENKISGFTLFREGFHPLFMGNVYYIQSSLDENHCGIISLENLTLNDISTNNLLKCYNGCLYKKITIDKNGNIKNCPYFSETFGNISTVALASVWNDEQFRKKWYIKKDDIEICQDCEFRYNCTDCRAFLTNKNNIYSKPLKCSYDPYRKVWEET